MTGFTSNVTYTAFDGSKWNMRVYEGQHVSLLIPDSWFTKFPTTIDLSFGVGPFPGLRTDLLSFLVSQIDKGYEFYTSLTGREPSNNPAAPNNLLRIAFLPELQDGAGHGWIGTKGIEIGGAYLEKSMFAAQQGQVQQTIFWHELGRNFSQNTSGDIAVKYVLTDYKSIPTFMGWEYGVAHDQFVIDQNYLLLRYYLVDQTSEVTSVLTPPWNKPKIPSELVSDSLYYYYNGSDIRPALAYQFYLEQGFEAYKKLAYNLSNNPSSDFSQFAVDLVKAANNNDLGLDYSYLLKNGSWQINNHIVSGPQNIQLEQTYGKVGVYDIFGSGADTVKIKGSGQFRLDGGDGYDQLILPISYDPTIKITTEEWVTVLTSPLQNLRIVLDFFEKIVFADGKTLDISVPYNSLFPVINSISETTLGPESKSNDVIKISFSEPVNVKVDPSWGHGPYDHYIYLQTKDGATLKSYVIGDNSTIISGSDVYLKLPSDLQNGVEYKIKFMFDTISDAFGNIASYKITPDNYSFTHAGSSNNSPTIIQGSSNNDILNNSVADEGFYGGLGTDVVKYNMNRGESIIAVSDYYDAYYGTHTNRVTIKDAGIKKSGSDVLLSIEKIQFNDGSLIFDVPNNPDNSLVYRLYQAAFARTPDEGGFRYWVDQHTSNNLNFNSMASLFISSNEFKAKYGASPSNAQLVDLLYQNILGRTGEVGGVSYWNNELNTGHQTKEQVLIGFAGSPENVAKTAANIDYGYWF